MQKGKLVILIVVAVTAALGPILAVVWAVDRASAPFHDFRVYEPALFETAADAGSGSLFPLEAKNIRVASWSHWIAHEQYMRFEAPVPVCLQHAVVLVSGEELEPVPADQLASDDIPPASGIFRDITWFDLGAAQNVVGAGGGSNRPQVWVDQNRGVLYYRLLD